MTMAALALPLAPKGRQAKVLEPNIATENF
jgi:hypothetical protein